MDSRFVHKMWDEEELSRMVEGGIPSSFAYGRVSKINKGISSIVLEKMRPSPVRFLKDVSFCHTRDTEASSA